MAPIDVFDRSERMNAIIGWALTSVVALGAVESFLTDAYLWGMFALLIAIATAVPAVSTGKWSVMIPWPLPLFAAVAVIVRAFELYLEVAGYIAVATLALIVVVELDAFTSVDMDRRFAVGFAVLTTMAIQGVWTVAQFYSDLWFGTEFLRSQTELQWDLVAVTVVGAAMGGVFEWYFERFAPVGSYKQPMIVDGS